MPGYAENFYTLMQWEMETFVTPFINISFLSRCSATIPKPLHNVIAILVAHKLANQQLDVNEVLMEIKALPLSVNSATSDEYDIAHMPDYFNAWWKENLGSCRVPDMLPKSSVQDVMELVEGRFSELPDHVETDLLPYMLTLGLVCQPDMRAVGNFAEKDDKLFEFKAVASSQSLMDQLNTDDSAFVWSSPI
ncbi:uncharacterized protein EDB93DRAFT_1251977 [Suillus bovinus]|uniref:uncharacterized protein n=1 Tax=Suillus bovinus TaxID=48563 RepID=UPI001B876939|nr:uncharacterized protein EDB93DRAFT_1251977 [Suillus bovinus]KAG2143561.1 hypothetical protein EDB93DRAFT_1251977 [Suillus bovinus]